jgi:hypothetical protein
MDSALRIRQTHDFSWGRLMSDHWWLMHIDFEEEGRHYREPGPVVTPLPGGPLPGRDTPFRQVERFVVRIKANDQEMEIALPGNLFDNRQRLASREEARAIALSLVHALNVVTGRIERGEFGDPQGGP